MTKTVLFHITTLSNLHAGSGDQNFGVVDNLVQRDPVTEIPMINSSSLKGAIRDHFETQNLSKKKIETIFGHAEKDSASAGEVKFLPAHLLGLPVRSNTQLYFLATTPQILEDYLSNYHILKNETLDLNIPNVKEGVYISTNDEQCWIEDFEADNSKAQELQKISKELFGSKPIVLMDERSFKTISLPIITRNKIAKREEADNNLFYEEVIPRHTLFYSYIITPTDYDKSDEEDMKTIFDDFIANMNTNIQVGANASIGYGICQFKEV